MKGRVKTLIGFELAYSPRISNLEKMYIRLLGVPISGLRIRLRRILPVLKGDPHHVLDAGCGRGVFSYQLARKFPQAQVVGVDIDVQQLQINTIIAERVGLKNLSFRVADITKLPFKEEFDLILSVDNLEHLEDDRIGLANLYQSLKPGGELVLHVPGYERRWFFMRFKTNFDVPGHHRPGYRLEDICVKLREMGFVVDSAHYTFGWLETVANNISYLITHAEEKNKLIYAILFPFLNSIGWLGRNARPKKGAGVIVQAKKI